MGDADTDLVPGQALVELMSCDLRDDVLLTRVRVIAGHIPAESIAPASLYRSGTRHKRIELHRCVRATYQEAFFESYDVAILPPLGRYVLQPWWLPDAMALVRDLTSVWTPRPFTDEGPDFCVLTYQSLEPGEAAYTDGRGHWISPEGYREFIEGDRLRLRHRARSPG